MKKIAIMAILGLCLFGVSGCEQEDAEIIFSITAEEQTSYRQQINVLMDMYYWNYDNDSLTFSSGIVPDRNEENEKMFLASEACEYTMESVAGKQAVIAVGTLLHYNGDNAGELICYFVDEKLSSVFYRGGYDHAVYSLLERNPYMSDGSFVQYENWQGMRTVGYTQQSGSLPDSGFQASGSDGVNVYSAAIVNGKAEIYALSGKTLSRYHTITGPNDLEATDATFMRKEDGTFLLAVLYGHVSSHTHEDRYRVPSDRLILYNNAFGTASEISFDGYAALAVYADGDLLLVSTEQGIETYEESEEGWIKTHRDIMRHRVTQFLSVDVDGDGVREYFMTDGLDLYMYHRVDSGFREVWRTHLGVESFYGALYSGDLNGDGIKEIYICDATGTTIRYILTEKGLRSSNEDIDYGQAIYPCDWNMDGVDDYWEVNPAAELSGVLMLSGEG